MRTIFRYTPSGMAFEEVLYDFKCGRDGKDPQGVIFRNNLLLGVTLLGGHGIDGPDAGTRVLLPNGFGHKLDFAPLHRRRRRRHSRQAPLLVRGDGVVFGTTYEGGGASGGAALSFMPSGAKISSAMKSMKDRPEARAMISPSRT